jgi:hypothetical protein
VNAQRRLDSRAPKHDILDRNDLIIDHNDLIIWMPYKRLLKL